MEFHSFLPKGESCGTEYWAPLLSPEGRKLWHRILGSTAFSRREKAVALSLFIWELWLGFRVGVRVRVGFRVRVRVGFRVIVKIE